jgi:hypothetical protein
MSLIRACRLSLRHAGSRPIASAYSVRWVTTEPSALETEKKESSEVAPAPAQQEDVIQADVVSGAPGAWSFASLLEHVLM